MKIQIKSIFEKLAEKVFTETNLQKSKQNIIEYVNNSNINETDKTIIIENTNQAKTIIKLQTYICNSLLKYEGMGVR